MKPLTIEYPTNDKREWYRKEYLKSDHWKSLKRKKLVEVPFCQCCRSTSNLDVHHICYGIVYDATSRDLVVLCRKCHSQTHWATENWSFLTALMEQSVLRNKEKEETHNKIRQEHRPEKQKIANRNVFSYIHGNEITDFCKNHTMDELIFKLKEIGLMDMLTKVQIRALRCARLKFQQAKSI